MTCMKLLLTCKLQELALVQSFSIWLLKEKHLGHGVIFLLCPPLLVAFTSQFKETIVQFSY